MRSFDTLFCEQKSSRELQDLYHFYNLRYFDGELPTVNIKYTRQVRTNAKAKASRKRGETEWTPTDITITNLYNFTEDQLKGILLHEMIHVYFMARQDMRESHGAKFMAVRKRIADASGLDIPETHGRDDYEDSGKTKKVYMVTTTKNEQWVNFYANTLKLPVVSALNNLMGNSMRVYKVSLSKDLLSYPVARKFNPRKWFRVDADIIQDLVKSAEPVELPDVEG